jgi:hypothetical protein
LKSIKIHGEGLNGDDSEIFSVISVTSVAKNLRTKQKISSFVAQNDHVGRMRDTSAIEILSPKKPRACPPKFSGGQDSSRFSKSIRMTGAIRWAT